MSAARGGCGDCVLSDGGFAVLSGRSKFTYTSSCKALLFNANGRWSSPVSMHDARAYSAYAAMA